MAPHGTQSIGLSSISSTGSSIELTEILLFDCDQLTNTFELNPWIGFDCVRLGSITECLATPGSASVIAASTSRVN